MASEPLVLPPSMQPTDIRAEAERLTVAIAAAGLGLRVMGGLAVWLTSPSVRRPPFERPYVDIDFAIPARDRRAVAPFFEANGYVPEKMFNALHGAKRLNFHHRDAAWTVDVIVDELEMSHRIDLRDRLSIPGPTLDLADLLMTKLQIWEINRKDLGDAACLLADHRLDEAARGSIDVRRIVSLTAADWGLCHTIERNLTKVEEVVHEVTPTGSPFETSAQLHLLRAAIEAAPKSLAWKTRAIVGERVRWYQTPEEVRH